MRSLEVSIAKLTLYVIDIMFALGLRVSINFITAGKN